MLEEKVLDEPRKFYVLINSDNLYWGPKGWGNYDSATIYSAKERSSLIDTGTDEYKWTQAIKPVGEDEETAIMQQRKVFEPMPDVVPDMNDRAKTKSNPYTEDKRKQQKPKTNRKARSKPPRARFYVGLKANLREVFTSTTIATATSHPQYNAVIGQFRTKAAAELMAVHGANNPHLRNVAEAERMIERQKKDKKG